MTVVEAHLPGRVVRLGSGMSLRINARPLAVGLLLVLLMLALFVVAIGTGELAIAPGDLFAALFGGGDAGTRPT